ncbi:MAG: 5'/3'-nucleotidase SurE [Alphaproteobacteria bacterium]|nr:5'/3'-nucleotidase SurE [Alphaproteobacteria bacterium]
MRILLTNDDGFDAQGLRILRKIAEALSDDVWLVAPETNQSGASHALTLQVPLRYREVGERAFAVKGTPADCVIMGARHVLKDQPPTLILSGVNHGSNAAEDVSYSGTIAGAMQGTHLGIRSIAMSLMVGEAADEEHSARQHWQTALEHGPRLVRALLDAKWPEGALMNINFPNTAPDKVSGVSVTHQGQRDLSGLHLAERHDTWGAPYFWIGFERKRQSLVEGSDLWALAHDRISVTPLSLKFTELGMHEDLTRRLADLDGPGGKGRSHCA